MKKILFFLIFLFLFLFMSGILIIAKANWFSFDKKDKDYKKDENLYGSAPFGEIRKADLKKIKEMINNNLLSGKEALHYEKISDNEKINETR